MSLGMLPIQEPYEELTRDQRYRTRIQRRGGFDVDSLKREVTIFDPRLRCPGPGCAIIFSDISHVSAYILLQKRQATLWLIAAR
jgi:hypothetical protein